MPDEPRAAVEKLPAAMSIAPEGRAPRLMGSAPTRSRSRRPQSGDEPRPTPVDAPPDLPGVSAPDVAFQFKPCLPAETEGAVISAVREAVASAADVRMQCFAGTDRLGIWMRPSEGAGDAQARDMGLRSLDLLKPGENFAAFINAALIRSQAADAFSDQPKRLNGDSEPDPHGPVHLTGLHVSFQAPNRVITTVDGFDERPWPDVDFHLITTDTLQASAGSVQIDSDHKLDTDTSWLNVLTAAMGALTVLVSGWFVLPTLIFFVEGVVVAGTGAPNTGTGAGAAADALPREIMIPAKLKVVMHYERVEVSEGGIFAGGFIVLALRTPSASINGGRLLAVTEHTATQPIRITYSVATDDLRKPLSFAWTADGTAANHEPGVIPRPSEQSTVVAFRLHDPQVGQVQQRSVAVKVTDADGLSAEAAITVRLHVVSDEPDDGDPLPPICRIKPWLPQCHPQEP